MSDNLPERTEFLLYQTDDDRIRIETRMQDETVWLTQKQMAELFQKDIRTINEHLKNTYAEGELVSESTIRKFRIVRLEGTREVARSIDHYNLDAIISVGYRVNSKRGTQFRINRQSTIVNIQSRWVSPLKNGIFDKFPISSMQFLLFVHFVPFCGFIKFQISSFTLPF